MLENAPTLAIRGVDYYYGSAENEPSKVAKLFLKNAFASSLADRGAGLVRGPHVPRQARADRAGRGEVYTEGGQTLQGSFSSVSKPMIATKYSFETSRRDLHNTLLRTAWNPEWKYAALSNLKCFVKFSPKNC